MPNYTYLLKHFQAGDRILLYARGKNGRGVYQFLKEQPQFQVIGFVDRNADTLTDAGIPVYRPNQLKAIPPEAFDKIMITVIGQEMGEEIYRIIRESGVPQEKIAAPYTYIGPETEIPEEEFLSDRVREELRKFIDGGYGNLLYFRPLIQSLKGRKKQQEEVLLRAKAVSGGLPPLDNIVFLHVLYEADIFDAELMRRIMASLLQIDRPELRQFLYSVWSDTTQMCFLHSGYLFPEFYNMRRELLKKLCGMYGFSAGQMAAKQRRGGQIRKICIVYCEFYQDRIGGGTSDARVQLCAQWSDILVNLGYEVQIITVDPRSYLTDTPVFQSVIWQRYDTSADFIASYQDRFPPQVSFVCEDACDLRERLQGQLDRIEAYSPDLILDMSDEYSILSYLYSQYFPTLYLPQRGYQSSSFFTYFAAREKAGFLRENHIYHAVDEDCVLEIPVCVLPSEPQSMYSREDFSLENDDFVLVTVGHRLNTEMSEEFIDSVCEKLLSRQNMKWLIVGSESDYLSQKYPDYVSAHKVIYIPYENDLPALYKICDLYINPRRIGGGASITWAMHCGLPIAALSVPSDVMPIIGIENTADNYDQLIDYALALWSDPVCWKRHSEKFQKRALDFEKRLSQIIRRSILEIEVLQKGTDR